MHCHGTRNLAADSPSIRRNPVFQSQGHKQHQPIVLEMQMRFAATSASFVLLCLLAALLGHWPAAAAETVNVGVILDLASDPGRRWRTSISMAVEDYYATHTNSTTRVDLHFRDSSGDAVAAASAGELARRHGILSVPAVRTLYNSEMTIHD